MRTMTQEKNDSFVSFNKTLQILFKSEPLKDISEKSSSSSQIIAFHLTCEYLIDRWIDFKVNAGRPIFKGVEKIGFHNRIYVAKNIGLPIELFKMLNCLNQIRNDFAHQIFKKELGKEKLLELVSLIDGSNEDENRVSDLSTRTGLTYGTASLEHEKLYFALQTILAKTRNFVFVDLSNHFSSPIVRQQKST